jgi:hypothetical protein
VINVKKNKFNEELPYEVEDHMYPEEDVMIKDNDKSREYEPPAGFEDILYEAWRESETHSQNVKKEHITQNTVG